MRPARCSACLALVLAAGHAAAQMPESVEHNGVLYLVEKSQVPGDESRTFFDGVRRFTPEELRAHVAAQPPRIFTADAEARLAAAEPGEMVELLVVLRNQPAAPIAREAWARTRPVSEALLEQVRAITARSLPAVPLPPDAERTAVVNPPTPADVRERHAVAELHDELMRVTRQEIFERIREAVAPDQAALEQAVAALGGEVIARVTTLSALGVRIPAGAAAALAQNPLVARIDLNHPGEPELNNSALALGVNTGFWAGGITGGVHDAGVLDTGVQHNHPALNGHPLISNIGSVDTGGHGSLIAGIMASTDATNRGMAFGLDKIVASRAGDILTSMPGMDFIASTGEPENTNYSFGNGSAASNEYSPTDQFFDGVIRTFGFMVSKSAGNSGFGSGQPTITHPAPAFNLIATSNINDNNTPARADDRINTSSSRGPTAGGRKKPDLTAPGTNIQSCNATWSGGALWAGCTGTSCAAPHVGGAIILLMDMGAQSVAAAKAILINTADAMDDRDTSATSDDAFVAGSFWNRRYGWGYMNLGAAHLHGLDSFVGSVPDEPENADFRLYAGPMFTHEKATLVWERHVAYGGAMYPTQIESLSDLDLFAYREADNQLLAASATAINNVEQISVSADEPMVVLKVEASGSFDPDIAEEEFALATQENFTLRTGPAFDPAFDLPASVEPGATFQVTVTVQNTGDLAAHGVQVDLSGVTVLSGTNPASIGTIAAGGTQQAVWTVRAAGTAGQHPISVAITSNSYGETFAGGGSANYQVGGGAPCYPNCDGSTIPPVLNVNDFICFQSRFAAGDPYANCDNSTVPPVLNVNDFICFQSEFAAGCR